MDKGKLKNKGKCLTLTCEYGAIFLSMKQSFVQNIKLLKQGSHISIVAIGGMVQEDVVIFIFYEPLCFDLSIKDNDVEIA